MRFIYKECKKNVKAQNAEENEFDISIVRLFYIFPIFPVTLLVYASQLKLMVLYSIMEY